MFDRLVEEISLYKGIEKNKITRDSNLIFDLGITSMELFEILFPFEELVDFSEQDVEMFNAETVGELADILTSLEK